MSGTTPVRRSQRIRQPDGCWATVVSSPHPHRTGCWVWRDGQTYTVPEFVRDDERGHREPVLPPLEPEPQYTVAHSHEGGRRREPPPTALPTPPLTLAEIDAELVRRAPRDRTASAAEHDRRTTHCETGGPARHVVEARLGAAELGAAKLSLSR